ncbi:MAG TPA: ribosome assembly cofactor RimP [Bacteroidales bacterium]|nr:ribosome assembly cofactor RimP [Bacteroidales bacterium]
MIDRHLIKNWVTEFLEGTDRFVVDVIVKQDDVIMVFLDADSQLTIDHCAQVSRMIESKLDREIHDYELRVSSAGIDHPLTMKRQYKKNINRNVKLELADGSETTGLITAANDEGITIAPIIVKKRNKLKQTEKAPEQHYTYDQIKEARIQISFQ